MPYVPRRGTRFRLPRMKNLEGFTVGLEWCKLQESNTRAIQVYLQSHILVFLNLHRCLDAPATAYRGSGYSTKA